MAKVRNASKGDLMFGCRVNVPALSEIEIDDSTLAGELKSPVVQGWIKAGKLVVDKTAVKAAEKLDPLDDLRAKATELGIAVDGRWGEERLKDEIAKAEGAK